MTGMLGIVYGIKEAAAHGLRMDTVVAAVLGAAALTLFIRRQLSLPHPLIDVRLFGNRAFSAWWPPTCCRSSACPASSSSCPSSSSSSRATAR